VRADEVLVLADEEKRQDQQRNADDHENAELHDISSLGWHS
jgi:hypothetical protein